MQKLEYDTLFLGLGPIGTGFASELTKQDQKVCVISDIESYLLPSESNSDNKIDRWNWNTALQREIYADTSYVLWRSLPFDRTNGPEIKHWLESSQFLTSKINHLSSSSVYANLKEEIYSEDFEIDFSFQRLNSKQIIEKFLEELSTIKSIQSTNYRISNVYGGNLNSGFINESLLNLKNGEPIRVFKNFDIVRDYLAIQDLISALVELHAMNLSRGSINISTGFGESISGVLQIFANSLHYRPKVLEIEHSSIVQKKSVLSCDKLKTLIQWSPKSLGEVLPSMIDFYLKP
jgi:nucleoside-diphosphate-sugar epimerase